MKKRLVAVMLGLTLSLATVGEAGAAAFSSPDSEMVQAEMEETENVDVFSAGDGDEQSRMLRQMRLTTYRMSSVLM